MPTGGIMVLGHDFHSVTAFLKSLNHGTEVPAVPLDGYRIPPTRTVLKQVFAEADIPLARCFFTNAYMGLRAGSGTTGRFPGARDPEYVSRCQAFLLHQLDAQRPRLLITLGGWVPGFIAPLAPKLAPWRGARTMKALDDAKPLVHGVQFDGSAALPCTVLALTHPSLRGPNVGRRRYGTLNGHAAEMAMLREAANASGALHTS